MPDADPATLNEATLPCDLLVFDLDGTLIDSEQDLANSVNATLAHLALPALPDHRIAGFVGNGVVMLLHRSLRASTEPTRDLQPLMVLALPFFLKYYRAHKLDFTYVYPGVLEELGRIRALAPQLPMAVLTNKPVRPSRSICDGLGLSTYFFANYGGDSFPQKKPDPIGMHTLMAEAAAMLGRDISPRRVVLVGDSHVDVATARAAGVLSLGCTYGLAPDSLVAAQPDALVETPTQWIAALRQILV